MVEPPQAVPVQQVSPREYIFVIDASGSMHGFPLETAKVLLQHLIGGLRPSDSFNVMLFSGNSRMLAPQSVPATMASIKPGASAAARDIRRRRHGNRAGTQAHCGAAQDARRVAHRDCGH